MQNLDPNNAKNIIQLDSVLEKCLDVIYVLSFYWKEYYQYVL